KDLEGVVVDTADRTPMALVELVDERLHELGDVVHPLAQGRYRDRQDIEPVVEIIAQRAVLQRLKRILVGGRHDPPVVVGLALSDKASYVPLLEDAQNLRLGTGLHLRHLVEEQGAAVSELETALAALDRAREGALLVAEDLALQQSLGNGRAVDGHERALPARRQRMHRSGNELLPRSALAGDQERCVRGRRHLDLAHDLAHPARATDETTERSALAELAAQELDLPRGLGPFQSTVEDQLEPRGIDRLGQVVVRTF